MTDRVKPLARILLPVDDLETFKRVAPWAGLLIRIMDLDPGRVSLLHAVAGSFLSDLMNRIDLAAGETPAPEEMKQLYELHLKDVVRPLLSQCGRVLNHETGGDHGHLIVKDGDPVKVINSVCLEDKYSTLIMSRRTIAETLGKLTGSVVTGVLHRHTEATIYLIGDEPVPEGLSPFARCLIAVDDSSASRNSVIEAGTILSRVNDQIEQVNLVHVLDQSCYYDEDGVSCMQSGLTGQKALEAAGDILVELGVDREKIKTVIHFGKPGEVLSVEINDCDATLTFIGRRDRSRMAQVYLGSVCTDIIQNCRARTLVLNS